MGDDLTKKDNDKDNEKDKDNDKDKYIQRGLSKRDPIELLLLRHMIIVMMEYDLTTKKANKKINTNTKTNTFREHIQIVIQETCDF